MGLIDIWFLTINLKTNLKKCLLLILIWIIIFTLQKSILDASLYVSLTIYTSNARYRKFEAQGNHKNALHMHRWKYEVCS